MRRKILIAVPTLGTIHVLLHEFLMNVTGDADTEVVTWCVFPAHIPHSSARNFISHKFLTETDCTHVLMLDSDVVPPPHVLSMAQHDKPITFGLYQIFNGHDIVPLAAVQGYDDAGAKTHPKPIKLSGSQEQLEQVDFVGGGCLMIRRDVLERFRDEKILPFMFRHDPVTGDMAMGEDYDFCEKARDLGFTIHIDRNVVCDHHKSVSLLSLNETMHRMIQGKAGTIPPLSDGLRNDHGSAATGEGAEAPRGAA